MGGERTVLIVGGGIGGLTAATALCRRGHRVAMVERDPAWGVYGAGITQQMNAIRALAALGLLEPYLERAFGFDRTVLHVGPEGRPVADFLTPRLAGPDYPANAAIRRTDLQKVLAAAAQGLGTAVRLGVTVEGLHDDGRGVDVAFSDGSTGRYDLVVGADGLFSQIRGMIMPEAPAPRYTGQWVWRCYVPRPDWVEGIALFAGPVNAGLVPLGPDLAFMFLLSAEPPGLRLDQKGAAAAMRARIGPLAAPQVRAHAEAIADDDAVVGRPLHVVFIEGPWHRGRVVLLGDAAHGSTPHLAQGAGMAIEDAVVLAEELDRTDDLDAALTAYRDRRIDRARYIAETSVLIGDAQMGKVPPVDVVAINREMIGRMARPI